MDLSRFITDVPDFPRPGSIYRDCTPLFADARAFVYTIDAMAAAVPVASIDLIAGVEARGFVLASALAVKLQRGFLPLYRPGNLPGLTVGVDYQRPDGEARLEVRDGSIWNGARVLLVDDVLASGLTMAAAIELVQKAGGMAAAASVLIELSYLSGRFALPSGFALNRVLNIRA